MSSVIDSLKTTLGLGARANKYRIIINPKGGGPSGAFVDTLAKNTTIPARGFADISLYVQGRLINIAGEAEYDGTWSVTFMDTQEHTLRGKFNDWMNFIDNYATHNRGATDHNSYMGTATVQQLNTATNEPTASYELYNLYPKSMSEISLSDDSQELVEFTVDFNYSHWTKI